MPRINIAEAGYSPAELEQVKKNLKSILEIYSDVLGEHIKNKKKSSIALPGAGDFPGLELLIDALMEKNPHIRKIKIALIDPVPNSYVNQLMESIQEKIRQKYPKLNLEMTYCIQTTQEFVKINPDEQFDIIFFQNPYVTYTASTMECATDETFNNGRRTAALNALKMMAEKKTLLICTHQFGYEMSAMLEILNSVGIRCVPDARSNPNFFQSIFLLPPKGSCKYGFAVEAAVKPSIRTIDREIVKLKVHDQDRFFGLILTVLHTLLFLSKTRSTAAQAGLVTAAIPTISYSYFAPSTPSHAKIMRRLMNVLLVLLVASIIERIVSPFADNEMAAPAPQPHL